MGSGVSATPSARMTHAKTPWPLASCGASDDSISAVRRRCETGLRPLNAVLARTAAMLHWAAFAFAADGQGLASEQFQSKWRPELRQAVAGDPKVRTRHP